MQCDKWSIARPLPPTQWFAAQGVSSTAGYLFSKSASLIMLILLKCLSSLSQSRQHFPLPRWCFILLTDRANRKKSLQKMEIVGWYSGKLLLLRCTTTHHYVLLLRRVKPFLTLLRAVVAWRCTCARFSHAVLVPFATLMISLLTRSARYVSRLFSAESIIHLIAALRLCFIRSGTGMGSDWPPPRKPF